MEDLQSQTCQALIADFPNSCNELIISSLFLNPPNLNSHDFWSKFDQQVGADDVSNDFSIKGDITVFFSVSGSTFEDASPLDLLTGLFVGTIVLKFQSVRIEGILARIPK
ncbi:hypothetical protein PIB30_058174, partial [Stylosanthes scabra]|nr:hypothetical protein [Stylosanthes scabra]